MMADLMNETLTPFALAAKELPGKGGKGCSPSTLWRWHRDGVPGPDGQAVHLEAIRIGTLWYTSKEAVRRFVTVLNSRKTATAPPLVTPTAARQSAEAVGKELERMGA
jgi:hypothetical protein